MNFKIYCKWLIFKFFYYFFLMIIYIGIDDMDFLNGMCIIYLGVIFYCEFLRLVEFLDLFRLICLNLNIFYKMCGNGVVVMIFEVSEDIIFEIKDMVFFYVL